MIQQGRSRPTAHPVTHRFQQICAHQRIQTNRIQQLVKDLFAVEGAQQESGLSALINCIKHELNKSQLNSTVQNIVMEFITIIIKQMVKFQYQKGALQIGQILVDSNAQKLQMKVFSTNNHQNQHMNRFKQHLNLILNKQQFKKITKLLSAKNIQQSRTNITVSLIKYLVGVLQLSLYGVNNQNNVTAQQLISLIDDSSKVFVRDKARYTHRNQLQIFINSCLCYQNIYYHITAENKQSGLKNCVDSIVSVFRLDNLQKKFTALSSLDFILDYIELKNKQQGRKKINLNFAYQSILALIFNPRNHQQILSRSLNFIKYWISNIQQPDDLKPLDQWLITLILKSDNRTSNIFGQCWKKLIEHIKTIGKMEVQAIYQIAFNVLQNFKIGKGRVTRSQKLRQQNLKQQEIKAMRVLQPLIKKQFLPFEDHEKNTLKFLQEVWKIRSVVPDTFQYALNQPLLATIKQLISPKFNFFVLQTNIQQLCHIVKDKNIQQSDENLSFIQEDITLIYRCIKNFMYALKWYLFQRKESNSLEQTMYDKQIAQIGNVGLALLTQNQILHFLIISHNSNNEEQLIIFLQMMDLIITVINNFEFQKYRLQQILRKVDISNEYFLNWIKNRLVKIQHNQFRQSLISQMLSNTSVYNQITLSGLNNLLEIMYISDINKHKKQSFCLNLLAIIKPAIQRQSIILIFSALWSLHQISQKKWLENIGQQVQQFNLSNELQILIYTQIIKLSEQKCIYLQSDVYSQNIAVQQEIQIKIVLILQEPIIKVIKCWDSISLTKFKKTQVQKLLNIDIFNQISIQSMQLEKVQINKLNYNKSLRKLGFKNDKINQITVHFRKKNYLIIKQLKDGILSNILNNLYHHNLTTNVIQICIQKIRKNLLQVLQKESKKENNNLQEITKQNLAILIKRIIKNIVKQKYDKNFAIKLNNQLVQFLLDYDKQDQLLQKKMQMQQWRHRKFMSREKYFIEKALSLLQIPIKIKKSKSKSKQSTKIENEQIQRKQKIGEQFINLLLIGKQMQNVMFSNLTNYLQLNPAQYPYLIKFGLQVLWMVLKDKKVMSMFLETQSFNSIFFLVKKCVAIALDLQIKVHEQLYEVFLRLIGTGFKIFNSIITIALVKGDRFQLTLLAQHPNDLLNLNETKQKINQLRSNQNMIKLKSENSDIQYAQDVLQLFKKDLIFKISIKQMIQIYMAITQLFNELNNTHNQLDAFFIFYEAAKLNCCTIVISEKEQQTFMISFLVKNLNTNCLKINLICKSILYIYLSLDTVTNCKKIIECLKQNFLSVIQHSNSKIYFQIFSECFAYCTDGQLVAKIIQYFTTLLIDAKSQKQGEQPNQSLEGILSIIKNNVNKFNTNATQTFIILMFNNYLFGCGEPIKAIHSKTRKNIYKSIQTCLEHHKQIQTSGLFQQIKQQISTANKTEGQMKQTGLGVGLQNLGNICYMNSLLQMLHSIRCFVSEVCKIKTQFPLLLGLQKLFLNLSNSQTKHISPQWLTNSFDPPINVGLQEDTTQFLIQFLDKLESGDKSKTVQHISRQFFKGQTISRMRCSECKKGRQLIEDFILYPVSLNNQGVQFKNLQEAIKNNKNAQIIYDVNCQNCKKKSKFTKQTQLKKIPNYFFIQLRRLIFDYNNPYIKVKVHSRLIFPDLLQINGQKLRLKSVITHSGTGQYGHYYTSVRQKNGKWIVYNDSRVGQMPQNGQQDIWYGQQGSHQSNHSTNAYVLLYQKITPQLENNHNIKIKNPYMPEMIKQIQANNNSLIIKKFIFGDDYKQDFTDFAFNLAKMHKTPAKLSRIYELLGSLTYTMGLCPSMPANEYFRQFDGRYGVGQVAETAYQYRQQNNTFLFHRDMNIRLFFYNFLIKIFDTLGGDSKQTIQYACWSVKKCSSLLKQLKLFISSGQFIKLLAYFFRKTNTNRQYIKEWYENKIIQIFVQLYKNRQLQIKTNYEAQTIALMQPFLQLLISFLMISRNGQQIHEFNEYQNSMQIIRQSMKNNRDGYIYMIFLCNSNQNYTTMLLQLLELNTDQQFMASVIQIVSQAVCDIDRVDVKTVKNICYMVIYTYQHYYSRTNNLKLAFIQSMLGIVFPYDGNPHSSDNNAYYTQYDSRIGSLTQRTYEYYTNRRRAGLMEILCRMLLETAYHSAMIAAQKVQAINYLLMLLLQLMKQNPMCVNYINNLPSPIALYADYIQFQWQCVEDLHRKIDMGTTISGKLRSPTLGQQLKQQVQTIRQITNQHNQMQNQQCQAIICGSICHTPTIILDCIIAIPEDRIHVVCYQYQHYWCAYRNGRLDLAYFVDQDYRLNHIYARDLKLIRVIKPIDDLSIQEQGNMHTQRNHNRYQTNTMEIDRQPYPDLYSGKARRLIQFRNACQSQYQFVLFVQCHNMKNTNIEMHMTVGPHKYCRIWVEKKTMADQWGQMKIVVNGQQLKVGGMMDM